MLPPRVGILLAALTMPLPALAQTGRSAGSQLAAAHYNTGRAEYRAGHFRDAAGEFQMAYDLSPDPALLFNIAVAWYDAGDFPKAATAYEAYLVAVPDAPDRAIVEARLASIRAHSGDAGTTLDAAAAGPADATAMVSPADVTSAGLPDAGTTVTVTPAAPSASGPHPVVFAGVGVGVLGVVSLVIGGGLYADTDGQFRACQQTPEPCRTSPPRTEDGAAVTMLWGGGALALVGTAMLLVGLALPTPRNAPVTALRVGFSPGQGLLVMGRF